MKLKCQCGNTRKFIICKCDSWYEVYCPICSRYIKCVKKEIIPKYEKEYIIKKRGC